MAFIDDLENILLGNDSRRQDFNELMKLTNESKNLSINRPVFDDSLNHIWGKVLLIFAYSVLIIVSIFGNVLVCYVIFHNKRMRTVTNFFIANMAISDLLLTCINAPFNIARNLLDDWPFGSVMCHLLNFSLMTSVYVSTFTLLGIALDRQRVLLSPLGPRMSKNIGFCVLALIWVASVGLSLPFGMYNKIQTVDFFTEKVQRCSPSFPSPNDMWERYLTVGTFLLQYVIPLTIIGITYGRIVRKLWVRTHVGAVTAHQQLSQQRAKRKSIKMLIVVVIVFAVCWMPLNLYQLLADFLPDVNMFRYSSTSFFICHWIAISSSCYNPFVYFWLNETFRAEVKSRFKCCFLKPKRVHPGVDINGLLLRADHAYHARPSRSFSGNQRLCIRRESLEKYQVNSDLMTKEQCQYLTESPDSGDTDMSISGTTLSGAGGMLETVPELPELQLAEAIDHLTETTNHLAETTEQTTTFSTCLANGHADV